MASSSKLKNIDAINKMLRGEHRSQTRKTFGFGVNPHNEAHRANHAVGDIWAEYDWEGKVICWWKQTGETTRKRYSIHPDESERLDKEHFEFMYGFRNCPKEECTCKVPTRLDKKFRVTQGMCFDCVTEEETKMKLNGTFDEFASQRIYANMKAFFRDRDQELEEMKKSIRNGYGFVFEDGRVDKWESENPEAMIERIETEYIKYRDTMLDYYNPDKVPED